MSLLDKLKKSSKVKEASVLNNSKVFGNNEMIPTDSPLINLALSGDVDGGLTNGLTMLAGPSKHFKTSFMLVMCAAFQRKYEDGVILFYDSEFGSPQSYFENFGVDTNRVFHTPVMNVEDLKFDIMSQLENITKEDNIMIVIDSVGNLASKKEVEDALSEKSVADMTRAKQLKSLFRMVTPYLNMRNIPMVAINHTYQEIGLFPKQIVGGGTGSMYSSDNVWIIGRSQNKSGTEIEGYNFNISIEKSRFVREKSKFPITVTWEGGIEKWSGLLDDALEGGFVDKPKVGWYVRPCVPDDKSWRAKQTNTEEFWNPVFENTDFKQYLSKKYKI
jgi:RecA/RadA recombinase